MKEMDVLRALLVRELKGFQREVELCADDAAIWAVAPGVTNSVATLGYHICGNLQHYVGHNLGGTAYVRDRDREFSRRDGTRDDLTRELATTIDVVERVVPALSDATLDGPYPERLNGLELNTRGFLWHLSTHLAHHLGQAGYLRRIVTGNSTSAGSIQLASVPRQSE